MCQENVFDDILERKKAFLDSKIKTLKKSKNRDFFFIKNLKFFHVFIFGKKSQQNVFHDILERKKAFLDSAKIMCLAIIIIERKKAFLDSKIRKLKKSKNHGFGQRKGHD